MRWNGAIRYRPCMHQAVGHGVPGGVEPPAGHQLICLACRRLLLPHACNLQAQMLPGCGRREIQCLATHLDSKLHPMQNNHLNGWLLLLPAGAVPEVSQLIGSLEAAGSTRHLAFQLSFGLLHCAEHAAHPAQLRHCLAGSLSLRTRLGGVWRSLRVLAAMRTQQWGGAMSQARACMPACSAGSPPAVPPAGPCTGQQTMLIVCRIRGCMAWCLDCFVIMAAAATGTVAGLRLLQPASRLRPAPAPRARPEQSPVLLQLQPCAAPAPAELPALHAGPGRMPPPAGAGSVIASCTSQAKTDRGYAVQAA